MALDCRAAAARAVAQVAQGQSLNQALPPLLDRVKPRDRALLQELSYGCLRQWPRLEALCSRLLDKPLRGKDREVRALILVGLYQLDGMRVPDHAAVASTVAATRALSRDWARGLVNAVLRRYLRERETLTAALSPAEQLAHPTWLYEALKQDWPEQADALMSANNERPPMALRVNARQTDRETYQQRLLEAGLESQAGTLADSALYLAQPQDVADLPGFDAGVVSVQDEAAQLAAALLDAQPGDRVLDACAAPGGKTCHILERQPELAELAAMDIDAERNERVRDNLSRLALSARLLVGDAADPPDTLGPATFDRILVDAPCSASGVIRRHPDIKLLRRPADITQLAGQQGRILDGLWPLLRPGGVLLYVTCSVLDAENSAVVDAFLSRQPDAASAQPDADWGHPVAAGRQLLPGSGRHDGLFFSRLVKQS